MPWLRTNGVNTDSNKPGNSNNSSNNSYSNLDLGGFDSIGCGQMGSTLMGPGTFGNIKVG